MNKIRKVFKRKTAFDIKYRFGIDWVGTEPNYNIPKFKVFLFEDTPKFRIAFNEVNNS